MWILLALLCLGVAAVMFSGMQGSIPDELSFLKTKPDTAVVETTESSMPLPPVATASAWNILASSQGTEISRDFSDDIQSATQKYDRPTFYLTCYRNTLYARIDTRLHAAGGKTSPVVWQGVHQEWVRGEAQNIYSPDTSAVLKSMLALKTGQPAQVSLSFDEAPRQTLRLRLDGLPNALQQLKKNCNF